ncbi:MULTISPECIES: ankyrin repeat domain-containing protein [Wolbachia]|uniref:ankyrin repeat domain-containing protein n=1 Tax=Wolbachia TaxID=953 RepID=UPI00068F5FCB|nr:MULTISPECIES: ankyrin repeat domain-containing protein [unclassified Wolbachia]UFN99898.1 ankyrin repeat domain-containing protein [Wolbachia endosymbiont of Corcyra cephalonica]
MLGSDFVSQESNKILKKSDSRDSGTEEGFEILEREEKERRRSEDSGNESQEESGVNNSDTKSSAVTTLEFQLTQSLLGQVKADENNEDVKSGNTAYQDLYRTDFFVINDRTIDNSFIKGLYDKYNEGDDKRLFAKYVFTEIFKHAKAEVPNDYILEELITSCNQAGYDGSLLMQLSPIFSKHKLILPHANDRKISIVYNSQGSLNVQYCPSMPVRKLDTNREICRVDAILEFTLKFHNGEVEYENGKVTLIISEELKAGRESLLDDINERFTDYDNDGFIHLHVAAQKGNVELGRHLLECGANIEIKSKTKVGGDTALHLAAKSGHKDFVKLLLDNDANVNSVSSTGSRVTPLHEAAYSGHSDVAELLIERGATVDAKERYNLTPLMYASAEGNSAMVELLLKKKADLYLQHHNGETALHLAADNGHSDVVAILIGAAKDKKKYVNMQSNSIGTALHVIAYNREINEEHKKSAKLIIDNGTSPYLENDPIINKPSDTLLKGSSLDMAKKRGNKGFLEFMSSLGYSATVPSNSKNDPQNTKKYVVAASALAITVIALGAAVAVYLEMLAIGIAVAVCCLIAATITYCYRPKSLVEDNQVKKVMQTEECQSK